MTIQRAFTQLMYKLYELYSEREAVNISDWIIESVTGLKKIDRVTNKEFPLNDRQQQLLENYTGQLLQYKPVQYVLKEAWFCGIKLYVDESVLIPRPETEELVEWIIAEVKSFHPPAINLLDIGTGSGCIAIASKRKLSSVLADAIDVSAAALEIAKKNAISINTEINFHQLNILDKDMWKSLPQFDIIVSNPPYIRESEAAQLQPNVIQYEPAIALLVPDNNALIFYQTIADFGMKHLKKNGKIFFEINETFGKEVYTLLQNCGYRNIELKKDLQGKERMVKADNIAS